MNYILISFFEEQEAPFIFKVVLLILVVTTAFLTLFIVFRGLFNFFEMAYVEFFNKKQFFNHVYLRKKKLNDIHKSILLKEFHFYKRLSTREQQNFDHRIQYFLNGWEFIGKDLEVTNTMKVMISATATKLTFGLRDYKIDCINKIIIYPETYYSNINKAWHKGEFNLGHGALVFSWEDFKNGYAINNDNINLGVHECIHAIHFTFMNSRRNSTSAAIFIDSFQELTLELDADETLKQKLIASNYIRDYAFENQFEFISVLVENFIETPDQFRSQFPRIYDKVKEMLNFNFAGY